MVVIVAAADAAAATALLQAEGETVYQLGQIRARTGDEHQTQVA
jgi:phosphoribosylformylglycinamidine cyclo-ligase